MTSLRQRTNTGYAISITSAKAPTITPTIRPGEVGFSAGIAMPWLAAQRQPPPDS